MATLESQEARNSADTAVDGLVKEMATKLQEHISKGGVDVMVHSDTQSGLRALAQLVAASRGGLSSK